MNDSNIEYLRKQRKSPLKKLEDDKHVPPIQERIIGEIRDNGVLEPDVITLKEFKHKRCLVPTTTKKLIE